MTKIPFEKTIAGAYRFFFTNILSMLGIGWFPILLWAAVVGAVVYLLMTPIEALIAEGKNVDSAEVLAFLPAFGTALFLVGLTLLIAIAMIYVGVLRKALGMHPGPVYFFFSLDGQVWQMVGAYLAIWLIAMGAVIVFGFVVGLAGYLIAKSSQVGSGVTVGVLVTLGMLAGYYALIRVQFFLPVIVVAENHIGIARSWAMGRGNFWRILGILLIMILPAAFAQSTITNSLLQIYMTPIDPSAAPNAAAQMLFHSLGTAFAKIGPIYAVVQLLYLIAVASLTMAASANAYRLVTGGDDIAPPKPAKA